MQQHILRILALALLALAAAGCSTTRNGEYSSLPPAPEHPDREPAYAGRDATPPPDFGTVIRMPADEYPDVFARIRAGYSIPDVQHYAIDREVEYYRSRPDFLDRTFRRGGRYLYYIVEEIEKRGMPLELALLPVVESAFNPVAYSRSRASGLWQFIPSTGKHYGLEQNWWIDERRDVIKATTAALDYLQYLNRYFNGDWYLAIAAYNGGEGTVSRAVEANRRAGLGTDFFSLKLRAETRDYVPKLLAMRRIVGNPDSYGLQFLPIPNQPYFAFVDPGRQVHVGEAADLAGINRDDMFALNPAFNRMVTPPEGPHGLLAPVHQAEALRLALAEPSKATDAVALAAVAPPPTVYHRVRRGESLSSIARRHGVSVQSVKEANGIRGTMIRAGDRLVIPVGRQGSSATIIAANVASAPQAAQAEPAAAAPPAAPRVHSVQKGDTLWGIARSYGVSVPQLAAANGLTTQSTISVGAKLKIPAGGSGPAAQEPARMTYKVRKGDTLSGIAGRFNVSVKELMAWNGIRRSNSLKAGQQIVLYVDPSRVNGG